MKALQCESTCGLACSRFGCLLPPCIFRACPQWLCNWSCSGYEGETVYSGARIFFVNFSGFFFANFLAFSCFSCGFQNMPSWFCLSSSSGGNSFLCIFLVCLVNFAGFQLAMASQRHRVSGTGPNLNVLQQHITSNPSSFCNSRLERRGGHRWPRQDSKAS